MAENKVLVTGASGFVGRHLVPKLIARSYQVTALGREPDRPVWLDSAARWLHVDLRNADAMKAVCDGPWWGVVHLAGETIPSQFLSSDALLANVAMVTHLIESVVSERLLFISSCHVYAPARGRLTEASPVRPQGRYGLSKHLAEQVALANSDRFELRIVRPFNHLGPYMRPELMAPSLLKRVFSERGSGLPLRMAGLDSTRDYLDVRDITDGYLRVLELEKPKERIFNVCSGVPRKVSELALAALAVVGDGAREIVFQGSPNSTDDTDYLVGDCSHLHTTTGWAPRYSLEQSLQSMVSDLALHA